MTVQRPPVEGRMSDCLLCELLEQIYADEARALGSWVGRLRAREAAARIGDHDEAKHIAMGHPEPEGGR